MDKIFVDVSRDGMTVWFNDGTMKFINGNMMELANIIRNLVVVKYTNTSTRESVYKQLTEVYIDALGIGMCLCDCLNQIGIKYKKIKRNKFLTSNIEMANFDIDNTTYNIILRDGEINGVSIL